MPPHLLVVGAGNSRDPGPARLRPEAKRGARWLLQPIGEEIVHFSSHHRCSRKHRPVRRERISEKGEELLGAQRTGGRTEARSWRAVAADRVHGGGVYERLSPPPSAFTGTPTPHVQEGDIEASSLKKKTTAW